MIGHLRRSLRGLLRLSAQRARRATDPVDWGTLRSLQPVSRVFGADRGTPVDRHYIHQFLERHAGDICGRALEVGDATYTTRYGGSRVERSDVLHAVAGNPLATLVGDLATGDGVPRDAFDCMILTQVLPFIYDVPAAVRHCHAALRPGGVVLATVPGLSQISRYDRERWGDFWRFTSQGAERVFEGVFGKANVTIDAKGNVLAATALLQGLAVEDLAAEELDFRDTDYEAIVTVRAVKAPS